MFTEKYADIPLDRPAHPAWFSDAARAVQEIYLYWSDCRHGRALPRRQDIDFAELGAVFGGVLLAEPASQGALPGRSDYVYRPIGPDGFDPTHGPGLDPALFQHIPVSCCNVVATSRAPLADRAGLLSSDGLLLDFEVVFLPLSPDGYCVDGVLILAVETLPGDYAC